MPVLDRAKIAVCLKCGREVHIARALRKGTLACPGCKEPIPQLLDLNRCTWEEGDNAGGKG
jgi:hypothetical protein